MALTAPLIILLLLLLQFFRGARAISGARERTRQRRHLWPVIVRVHERVFKLDNLTLLSSDPLASSSGSPGLKATYNTMAVCPTNRHSSKKVSASLTMTKKPSARAILVPHLEYVTQRTALSPGMVMLLGFCVCALFFYSAIV